MLGSRRIFHLKPLPLLPGAGTAFHECELLRPKNPQGVVLFSGGKNLEAGFCEAITAELSEASVAVLRLPLLEAALDEDGSQGDLIPQLRPLLHAACAWLAAEDWAQGLPQGYFGVGGMAALMLQRGSRPEPTLRAMVIVEGSAEMSEADLDQVEVPSLFIADAKDPLDAELHQVVSSVLHCESKVLLLDPREVPAPLVAGWFLEHFEAFNKGRSPTSPTASAESAAIA